jgi:2-hydroxychromene-2-carboxylate isomerase
MSESNSIPAVIWYFDFISPFAYLQWQAVKQFDGCRVDCRPILFAGLLNHHGHKGPAEIASKRRFTYRHVQWRAEQKGIALNFPPAHPFNPLNALRLCIAAGNTPEVIDQIFDHLWQEGRAGESVEDLRPVANRLGVADLASALSAPGVKAALQDNFQAAVADEVFGVPTLVAGDALFWGEDATGLFEAWLRDPGMLDTPTMKRLAGLPVGTARRA